MKNNHLIIPSLCSLFGEEKKFKKKIEHNVEHIRRQGFVIPKLVYFRKFNRNTKAESLHFCPAFVYALLAVVLFVKLN